MLKILILATFSLCFASNRVNDSIAAKAEFEEFTLFKDGKGMVISPNLIKVYDFVKKKNIGMSSTGIAYKRWGLNLDGKKAIGLFSIPYKGMKMGVLGCVACHSGQAAGQLIIGLGNKNINVGQIGIDAYIGQFVWGAAPRSNPDFKSIHKQAMHFTKILANKKINNLTQGLVPTSLVKTWFYEIQHKPIPKNFGRGQVKVPHLWGYGEKKKKGSFWDGFATGEGWAAAVELRGGQDPENVRAYMDKVHAVEEQIGEFLPPKYPFKINYELALRGKKLFENKCSKCHGHYKTDSLSLPIYQQPKIIPKSVVKTDTERLDFVSDSFVDLIKTSPLSDLMTVTKTPRSGYVAPRLEGIWSRFPYLHNASVPTVYDLLSPANDRPLKFSMKNIGTKKRFDAKRLGATIGSLSKRKNSRTTYDVSRVGHSNEGHEFKFYPELTHVKRLEIIEYLKTL